MAHGTGWLVVLSALSASPGDWPGWRGPDGTGACPDKALPLQWGPSDHVRWKVALPGPCNSSPVVWGDRVFVAQAVKAENRRTVMCFDRADGKLLWQSGVTYAENEPTQPNNPYCSATPVTDGERVIASFGSAGLHCYDFAGKEIWARDFGKMLHMHGNASSPVLCGDLCILNFGPGEKARLIAVEKRTGKTVWEAEPPAVDPSEQRMPGFPGGFPGGPGGPGRGGFGPGPVLAPPILSQGDKDGDGKLSREEFFALADAWWDKVDPDKAGKVSRERFAEKFGDVLPAPRDSGPPGGGPPEGGPRPEGRRGGSGPARMMAPGLFAAADADRDGSLSREEWKATFAKWFSEWDADKSGSLDEGEVRAGLTAALPRSEFGGRGPGGPGGRGEVRPGGRGDRGGDERGPGGRKAEGRGPGGPGRGGFGGGLTGAGASPFGTWSTPLVIRVDDHDELVMAFPNRLAAYDPRTGKQLWIAKGIGAAVYASPVWGDGILVAISGDMGGGSGIAVRPGGSGDVTESRRAWRRDRVKSVIGSGVIHDGRLFAVAREGIVTCTDLKSGEKVWEERLAGPEGPGDSWSSMLLADGKIYLPNQAGDVFVLRAGPKFELLAVNSVGEHTNASLAASGGEIFLRTSGTLWCFSEKK